MTTADRWTQTVRRQLGLGRLLPLGGPGDGAWIAERAARAALLSAAREVGGVSMGRLRIAPAAPEAEEAPAVPPPPSALPPGPLRVTADFAATASEPLPATAGRLRAALAAAATRGLGLTVTEVDLRVSDLLDADAEPAPVRDSEAVRAVAPGGGDEGRAAEAALAVAGVARLTDVLGHPVHITELPGEAALPRRHVRLELAVGAGHRTVEVARQVRTAVSDALPDHPSVAVLVTAII
ncbi:nucleopolyhedrovirus P10 family protein [Streptomyces sp. TRM S81-3]|uniref:Nucleopolyhedrovirus P10 family protein n=1 Tax=Streptomyces griseicoloratus TaxID=2752516 RepID=A0A926L3V8_9ACTN|nr:nucleopolyhedrovirus P10 family protein [Streptomyces griseicoloratus]MBD0420944.1 nucleopolyhedrovirus P10 family protein [Streptomyces griseicoloratus]